MRRMTKKKVVSRKEVDPVEDFFDSLVLVTAAIAETVKVVRSCHKKLEKIMEECDAKEDDKGSQDHGRIRDKA